MRGKVWLVGWLLVVGLSVGTFAGPLSGQWSVWGNFEYDADERVMLMGFETLFEIDYTTCGWTLTGSALFSEPYLEYSYWGYLPAYSYWDYLLEYVWFTASGSLGAIDFHSALTFGVPVPCYSSGVLGNAPLNSIYTQPTMDFLSWISSARMSIAGVDLFGIFAVLKEHELNYFNYTNGFGPKFNDCDSETDIGSGMILGGSGSAGDCDICVQMGFNLWRSYMSSPAAPCICHYGWDWVLPSFTPIHCCGWWIGPDCLWWVDPTCCLPFSWATIYLEQSFACFDLTVDVLFTCEDGFEWVYFTICNIDLGLPWLKLGMLGVDFYAPYEKDVWADFDLVVADCVCFTPYLVLDTDHFFELDGIGLAALTVEYDMGQGVTFKAGHRFFDDPVWVDWEDCQYVEFTAFTETGDVVKWTEDMYCYPCWMYWDEYIGFMIDGDACCGGHFDAWIFTWFNGGGGMTQIDSPSLSALNPMSVGPTPAFMDWKETRVKLDFDIGTNFTVMLKVSLTAQGLNWLTVGAETRW